jgi:hypothetical protein
MCDVSMAFMDFIQKDRLLSPGQLMRGQGLYRAEGGI